MPTVPKLYFAHALQSYGTPLEKESLSLINSQFPDHEVINPRDFDSIIRSQPDEMEYCIQLVSTCKTLVFSRWDGYITPGVAKEVNHAIQTGLNVFELADRSFKVQNDQVKGLNLLEYMMIFRPDELRAILEKRKAARKTTKNPG